MFERIPLALLFLVLGIAAATTYFFVRDYDLNRVEISVIDVEPVEDLKVTVGFDSLTIGTVYAGYKYRYAFRSPGEGSVSLEGKIGDKSFECKGIGYITPYVGSHTLIEISKESGVKIYHGGTDQAWACSTSRLAP